MLRQTVARQFSSSSKSSSNLLIINAVGQDRLGLVSEITGHVVDHGGSVGDSQAAKLGPYFSLMMLVDVPTSNNLEALKQRLATMQHMNATVFQADQVQDFHAEAARLVTPQAGYTGYFSLEGADHPGIVHKLTTAMASHGLSIDKLHTTDQEIAPYGGAVLFKMKGIVTAAAPLAQKFDAAAVQKELEELGDSLNCQVTLEEVDPLADADYESSIYAG